MDLPLRGLAAILLLCLSAGPGFPEAVYPTPTPCPFRGPCAQAMELHLDCFGPVTEPTGVVDLVISTPIPITEGAGCGPVPCDPILTCHIPCGALQAPECPFPSQVLAGLVAECLNSEGSGNICITPLVVGQSFRIESNFAFTLCVSGTEMDLAPGFGYRIASGCPVANLCDGERGNEHATPTGGVGFSAVAAFCDTCPPCVEAATLTVDCTGTAFQSPCVFTLSASFDGTKGQPICAPVSCATALAACQIDLSDYSAPKTDLSPCGFLRERISEDLVTCLNKDMAGMVCAATGENGQILIRSSLHLRWCLCHEEIPSCSEGFGLPLSDICSVVNLCDGTRGNEAGSLFNWTSGLSLRYETASCEEPTPTPSVTSMASRTATPSLTQTRTPSPTLTATSVGTPTQTPIPTATHTPLGCDSGYYILDSLGGRHRVGQPAQIDGSLFFGEDRARDMEMVRLEEYAGNPDHGYDLVVLDSLGNAHYVAHAVSIPQDFALSFDLDLFPKGRAVDLEVTSDGLGYWILTDFGGIYRAGSAKDSSEPGLVPGTDQYGVLGYDIPYGSMRGGPLPNPGGSSLHAVALAVIDTNADNRAEGYIVIDSQGARYQFAPDGSRMLAGFSAGQPSNSPMKLLDPAAYVWPFFPGLDIARDCELHLSGQGMVIYDGWGGVHPVPVDIPSNPVFFANNRNPLSPQDLITTVGLPYITTGFDDPSTAIDESDPDVTGRDVAGIFIDIEFCRGGEAGMYVMDRYGAVFAFGAARGTPDQLLPPFEGNPFFFPQLLAEDLEAFPKD